MSVFSYTAKDGSGRTREGTVDARSVDIATNLLRSQGLYVINIFQKRDSLVEHLSHLRGIPTSDVVAFTRQFSTMVSAGLPIARALEVLSMQATNSTFGRVIKDVLHYIEGGASLGVAMGNYPNVFSPTYRSLVSAGETSGKLDEILNRLAQTLEDDRELNAKFKGAMIYPAIVMLAMAAVFSILMVAVIPKLADMYESLNVPLPAMTRAMIGVSDFMVHNKILLLLVVVGSAIGFRSFSRTEAGRHIITRVVFKLPVFGKVNRQKDLASFSRTLSLLISAAIPIVEALETVADVVRYHKLKEATITAAREVEKGNSLSAFFRTDPSFPPLLGQMSTVGEETGQMDQVLERVADYYAGEVDHLVKGLSAALEPLILVMLGGMVGFLIVSIITPIYKITNAL
jgi:type IV pilus assembly protein PilC